MLAQLDVSGLAYPLAGAASIAILLLALLGRFRLPLGVSEAWFVGALSGALLLSQATLRGATEGFVLGISLAGLAILWVIVAVWIERAPAAEAAADLVNRHVARCGLARHAAALAGLLAIPALTIYGAPLDPPALQVVLGMLLVAAGGLYFWRRDALARHAAIALAVLLLVSTARALPAALGTRAVPSAFALLLAGGVSLAVAIATILADWRLRTHLSRTAPEGLAAPPPKHRHASTLVVVLGVLVGVGGLLRSDAVTTPVAVGLAAIAVSAVGHRRRSNALGELGVALTAATAYTVPGAGLPRSAANGLFGCALAGVWMLWLARFWHQQLNQEKPWTTAGRLIPLARQLSHTLAGAEVLMAGLLIVLPATPRDPHPWLALVTLLFMLLHWTMLVRDAAVRHAPASALAACAVLVAALSPAHFLAASYGVPLTPELLLTLAALALALRVSRRGESPAAAYAYNAYLGGLLPLAMFYDIVLSDTASAHPALTIAAGAGLLLAIGWRWGIGHWGSSPACSAARGSYNGAA